MVNYKMSTVTMILVAVAVIMATNTPAMGQNPPSCAAQLVPCANYMNATNPPASCCNPLRQAVTNELDCLCNLYNTPGFLASIGINVSQALTLPGRCGISGDLSACRASGPSSPQTPPPPVPGSNANIGKATWTGISSLLLLSVSLILS